MRSGGLNAPYAQAERHRPEKHMLPVAESLDGECVTHRRRNRRAANAACGIVPARDLSLSDRRGR